MGRFHLALHAENHARGRYNLLVVSGESGNIIYAFSRDYFA